LSRVASPTQDSCGGYDQHTTGASPNPASSDADYICNLSTDVVSDSNEVGQDVDSINTANIVGIDGANIDGNSGSSSSSSTSDSHDSDHDSSSSASSSVSSLSVSTRNSGSSSNDDSNSELSDSEDDSPLQASKKVFERSNLSVDEGVLSLLNLFMKKKLEKSLMGDILEVLLAFLPKNHNMPKTQHLLFKYVKDLCPLTTPKIHLYCKKCQYYVGEENVCCPLCSSECNKFIQLSLAEQIRNLFELHNLADVIDKFESDRMSTVAEEKYSDLCDGSEFKRAWCGGQYDLVLHGYTDGVSLSDSSDVSFWPVEFQICQIPFNLRFQFILISAIWVDSTKPLLNTLLLPVAKELEALHEHGVKWTNPVTKMLHTSRISAPGFCGDAPVRAQVQNISQHGGKYCCGICEQKMISCTCEGTNEKKRVFHLKEVESRLRTAARMEKQGKKTIQMRKEARRKVQPCKGVKGRSVITKFPTCDRSKVVYPEYMHILIGIMKLFYRLWFKTNAKDQWSLKAHEDDINSLLASIKVPDRVRTTRPLDSFPKWKASECRSFLLFYSVVVLSSVMQEKYFQHWLLFVSAMYSLLQDTVTETEVVRAETMLRMFLRDFGELYRAQDFSYNMHNLGHMGLTTRLYGPLWASSAFKLESLNGDLRNCIHGTKNQAQELVNTLTLFQGIQVLKARVAAKNICADTLIDKNVIEFRNRVKLNKVNEKMRSVLSSCPEQFRRLFYRAVIKGETYTSVIYSRQVQRNNYTVCYINSDKAIEYGEIFFFGESVTGEKKVFVNSFAVEHLRTFRHTETQTVIKHVIPVKLTDRVAVIPADNILFKVIRVCAYICLQPNNKEIVL